MAVKFSVSDDNFILTIRPDTANDWYRIPSPPAASWNETLSLSSSGFNATQFTPEQVNPIPPPPTRPATGGWVGGDLRAGSTPTIQITGANGDLQASFGATRATVTWTPDPAVGGGTAKFSSGGASPQEISIPITCGSGG